LKNLQLLNNCSNLLVIGRHNSKDFRRKKTVISEQLDQAIGEILQYGDEYRNDLIVENGLEEGSFSFLNKDIDQLDNVDSMVIANYISEHLNEDAFKNIKDSLTVSLIEIIDNLREVKAILARR